MFRPEKMAKVNILLLGKYVTAITRDLGRSGLLHLVDAASQSDGRLQPDDGSCKDAKTIAGLLERCGRLIGLLEIDTAASVPSSGELSLAEISARLERIEKQCATASARAQESGCAQELSTLFSQLKDLQASADAQKNFGHTSRLTCISGWAPVSAAETLRRIVDADTDGTGIVEMTAAEDTAEACEDMASVPVKMNSSSLLRPFQMLICNFGVPRYNELDPSLFVGITFVLFFGFMFGDLGQGAVLAGAGIWMLRSRRAQALKDAGMMLTACGICAMLFGILYGSVFGYEKLFEPVWLNPLNRATIKQLLLTAVGLGIVITSLAIVFNIINHVIAGKCFDGIFDRFGLLGLLFYWLGLGTLVFAFNKKACPPVPLLVLLAVPLLLLFLRAPVRCLLHRRDRRQEGEEKEGWFNMLLEACIEVMETFTGYISGTVSFVRVGAFAISHAALCLAIFSIVEMLQKIPVSGVSAAVSAIVIVFGNILVICFEGMVAMIQCVRLEYYELFGKYFTGGGIAYAPFKLEKQENVRKQG